MEELLGLASLGVWSLFGLYVFGKLVRSIRMVPNKTELIVERLGRYHGTLGPGFHVLLPFIDRVAFVQDMKEEAIDVPPQDCFTKDNVRVEVDGIIYLSVINSKQASYGITDFRFAAIQLAQTTTRSVIGTLDLDQTFEERDIVSQKVVSALNEVSDAWGIKVHRYEVKNIVPPQSVRDAMEQQMAAERERRTLIARAEGERQARINQSEGKKAEMINRSEGEMRRRVNEAEGRAQEILSLASATAESIEKLGRSIAAPGGADAVRLKLSQQLLTKVGGLAAPKVRVVLPLDLTDVDRVLASVDLGSSAALPEPKLRAQLAPPTPAIAAPSRRLPERAPALEPGTMPSAPARLEFDAGEKNPR